MADDDKLLINYLSIELNNAGHTVIAVATSFKEALELIQNLTDVDVGLVDGNLSWFSTGGKEGKQIAAAFREKFPGKPLFSTSVVEQPWSDDPNLTTRNGYDRLVKRVTEA